MCRNYGSVLVYGTVLISIPALYQVNHCEGRVGPRAQPPNSRNITRPNRRLREESTASKDENQRPDAVERRGSKKQRIEFGALMNRKESGENPPDGRREGQTGGTLLSDIPQNPLPSPAQQPERHLMTVMVKTLTGAVYTIETAEEDTLLILKQKIEEAEGTPVDRQRVVVGGKVIASLPCFPIQQACMLSGGYHVE